MPPTTVFATARAAVRTGARGKTTWTSRKPAASSIVLHARTFGPHQLLASPWSSAPLSLEREEAVPRPDVQHGLAVESARELEHLELRGGVALLARRHEVVREPHRVEPVDPVHLLAQRRHRRQCRLAPQRMAVDL